MPFNGSGGTSQPAGGAFPATANTLIESAKVNISIADIYAMLATAILKDGQQVATQRVPFAQGISADTILEQTSGAGVTIDGVLIKDAAVASSLLSFLQAGTGAVSRTVQSVLRDVVSVLDFIPEALHADIKAGTSVTDVSTYIQSAITALQGTGKTLYFPDGTYMVGVTLLVTAGSFAMVGASKNTVTLKRLSGAIASVLQIGATTGSTQINYVQIADMRLHGNSGCTDAVLKIRNVGSSHFRHLFVGNGSAKGLRTDTSTDAASSNQFKNEFYDITSENNTGDGFLFQGEKLSKFDMLDAWTNGGAGIIFKAWKYDVGTSAETTSCVVGSIASHTNTGDGVVFDQAEKYTIGNINATVNSGHGIRFLSSLNAASGNGSNSVQIGCVVLRNNGAGGVSALTADNVFVAGLQIGTLWLAGSGASLDATAISLDGAVDCNFGSVYAANWPGTAIRIKVGAPLGVAGQSNRINFGNVILNANGDIGAVENHGISIQDSSANIQIGRIYSANLQTTGTNYEIAIANTAGPIIIDSAILKPNNTANAIAATTGTFDISKLQVNSETIVTAIRDGVTAPAANVLGLAKIYVDAADGDLKIRFADGTVKTIVVDT